MPAARHPRSAGILRDPLRYSTGGPFCCSSPEVNAIQDCTRRSDTSNMVHIPMDCPQREKNGWTADAAVSAEQFLYNFDCFAALSEWLRNVRKSQREDGVLPGIIPTGGWGYVWGNGPLWDSVIVELPYQLYRFSGERAVIEDNKSAILRYFDYLETRLTPEGLLNFGMVDWCEASAIAESAASTPVEVTDTLAAAEMAHKGAVLLESIGDRENAERLLAFRQARLQAFRKKYVDEGCRVTCHSQTGQAVAIQYGVFIPEERPLAYAYLLELIHQQNDHFKVGVLSIKALLDVLSDCCMISTVESTVNVKT